MSAIDRLIALENIYIYNYLRDHYRDVEDVNSVAYNVHYSIVNGLIELYLKRRDAENGDRFFRSLFEQPHIARGVELDDSEDVVMLCEQLHIKFLNTVITFAGGKITRSKSKQNRIETGSVYTRKDITRQIVDTTIANYAGNIKSANILDFACGTGRFYEEIVECLSKTYGIDKQSAVLEQVYAIDIDPIAINITRLKAISYCRNLDDEVCEKILSMIILRNALVKTNPSFIVEHPLNNTDFNGLVQSGFDIIVSNPPYWVLKPSGQKHGEDVIKTTKSLIRYFRTSEEYEFSIEGMLNYYQISIEAMLHMLKPKGELGVICPSTLFADKSATALRRHMLTQHNVRAIVYYSEKDALFENVSQATNIFYLQKQVRTSMIKITQEGKSFSVDINNVVKIFGAQYEVPCIPEIGWRILEKLSKYKKLKECHGVRNRRGELDLTLCKKYITTEPTGIRLVRGNMLSDNDIRDCNHEYVIPDFLATRSADFLNLDYNRRRLVCPQISNTACKKRLKFIFCEPNDVLGNSCNYISSDATILAKLYILLNSSLMNWRFKVTSSNNHINNYEIDELPIVDLSLIDVEGSFKDEKELNCYIGGLYGLSKEELEYIS